MHAQARSAAAAIVAAGTVSLAAVLPRPAVPSRPAVPPRGVKQIPAERHLRNVRQLTFGGQNAEAYFSLDGQRLIFQSTRDGYPCDQIYTMRIDGSDLRRVSTGAGRTTCGYYYPGGKEILFASTHRSGPECPPKPSYEHGYVWPLYEGYDIYRANADGSNLRALTMTPGYDAEATIAPDGLIAFTSVRDGDMEIYTMRADGSDVKRLTNSPGPDGGPFFSWDGKRIAYRAHPLQPGPELDEYLSLLKQHLFRPTKLEIYVMDRDGKNQRQLTTLDAASFAPSWTADNRRIIFASNVKDPQQRSFAIFIMNDDGTGLEQLTYSQTFDGFPMFSPDGKHLVFESSRNGKAEGEMNVFIADWIE